MDTAARIKDAAPFIECTAVLSADGLALPGFTFGLDVVILVGHLRLSNHQTVDEVHQTLQERLSSFHLTISRREVMSLFEAYCSVLRVAHQPSDTPHWQTWRAKVEENGGVIISIDGIQPDKGNETIYLVRDVLDFPCPVCRKCQFQRNGGYETDPLARRPTGRPRAGSDQ